MLNNKLGIKDIYLIKKIEYYLFNIKYHIINANYTFNETDIFDSNYLEKIHIFLFSDIYDMDKCKIRKSVPKEDIDFVNEKLKELENLLQEENYKKIRTNIYDIWERQLFYDGNTRTILCFLKILSEKYNLNISYDFTKDIDKDSFISELVDSIGIIEKVKNR